MKIDKINESILSQCDDEPIHLLGRIQSHGYLLTFSKKNNQLSYASINARDFFGQNLISKGKKIEHYFDENVTNYFESLKSQDFTNVLYTNEVSINQKAFLLFFSNAGDYINVELEQQTEKHSRYQKLDKFQLITKTIKESNSLEDLFTATVDYLKDFTLFDRVMIYQFDEHGDGEIIAENKSFELDSFLGLKYPATDIPKQARRLYLTNLSRSIRELSDEGILIEDLDNIHQELDLSYSVYRSVSRIHVQYLENMGVTATHVVSIIINNQLWGMLIFHHYKGAKFLDFNTRFLLELITSNLSNTIQLLELNELRSYESDQKKLLDKISYYDLNEDFSNLFRDNWLSISKQLKVCGVTVFHENKQVFDFGNHPPASENLKLHNHIKDKNDTENIEFFDSLISQIPSWQDEKIAGCLCYTISSDTGRCIYFWREAKEQHINWAGNPNKAITIEQSSNKVILTPRASFELWVQKEKNKSLPWQAFEKVFAKNIYEIILQKEIKLYKNIFDQNSKLTDSGRKLELLLEQKTEELFRLNLQLQEELKENKEFQKELQIAIKTGKELNELKTKVLSNVSHEVRTPITSVIGLSTVLLKRPNLEERDKKFIELMLDSSKRLLETVNRILNSSRILNQDKEELQIEKLELVGLSKEIISLLEIDILQKFQNLVFLAHHKNIEAFTDKHYYNQIFTNLVSNAIKYTPNHGRIEINLKKIRKEEINYLQLSIEDNGIGIDEKVIDKIFDPYFTEEQTTLQQDNSSGLGLFFVKTHISSLGGSIDVKSVKNEGTLFTVLIPTKN